MPGSLPTLTPPTSTCPSYKASREEGPPLLPETPQDEDGPAAPRCAGCGRRARWVRGWGRADRWDLRDTRGKPVVLGFALRASGTPRMPDSEFKTK